MISLIFVGACHNSGNDSASEAGAGARDDWDRDIPNNLVNYFAFSVLHQLQGEEYYCSQDKS